MSYFEPAQQKCCHFLCSLLKPQEGLNHNKGLAMEICKETVVQIDFYAAL